MSALDSILSEPEVARLRVTPEQARAVLETVASRLERIEVRRGLGRGRGYGPPERRYAPAADVVRRWAA